jgi:RHS repeat-associated protein
VTTTYVLDLNVGLTHVLSDGTDTYLYGLSRIGEEDVAWDYYLSDAQGSVRQLTDGSGVVSLAQTFEPYGKVWASVGTGSSDYAFTGEFWDGYIKLIYLRSRYYAHTTGRFLTKDVWQGDYTSPLSLNSWNYVEGNPVNFTDPSGTNPYSSNRNNEIINEYWRFDFTLSFIYSEMINNAKGSDANAMRNWLNRAIDCNDISLDIAQRTGLLVTSFTKFFINVRPNGIWDHKPQLRNKLSITDKKGEYFPIRGDDEFEYFYDIWSNIHYGYVGASIGFANNDLQYFANLEQIVPEDEKWDWLREIAKDLFGQYDPGDVISVDIGIQLWEKFGDTLSEEDLHLAILQHKPDYFRSQDINGSGKIENSEVSPIIGKLLPSSYEWFDWE